MREHLSSLFARYPYRCQKCGHRELHSRYASRQAIDPALRSGEKEVKATRAVVQWKRKRREFLLYGGGLLLFAAFLYFITRERSSGGSDGN